MVPFGSEVVVTRGSGLMVMEKLPFSKAEVGICESVTLITKLYFLAVPAEFRSVIGGVPLITPCGLRLKPGGRVPESSCQANGPCPPMVPMVTVYDDSTTPSGTVLLAMSNAPGPLAGA